MRGYLLIAIVAVICVCALFRPKIGLYGYLWYSLMEPDVLAFVWGAYPFSLALAVCTFIGSARYVGRISLWFRNPIIVSLLVLQAIFILSAVLAQDPSVAYGPLFQHERMMLVALMIPILIRTESDLRMLVLVMAWSVGVLGTKFGLYGMLKGGIRYSEGFGGGMTSGNNELAEAFCMAVPLVWYSCRLMKQYWARLALIAMVFLCSAAVVMTYSRGGAVGLGMVMICLALQSRRKVALLVLFAILTAPVLYMVKDTYFNRLATIKSPEEEKSAALRIANSTAAIEMWKDYPWMGVGFGMNNWVELSSKYLGYRNDLVVHNTYTQILVDSGIFALVLFVAILFGTMLALELSRRRVLRYGKPEWAPYPAAICAALIGYAVTAGVGSRQSYDFYYFLLTAAATWLAMEKQWLLAGGPEAETEDSGAAEGPAELRAYEPAS